MTEDFISIDHRMTAAEVEQHVGGFLGKIRPLKHSSDYLVIELNYKHPDRVRFIQTAPARFFTVNVEIAQYEAEGTPARPAFEDEGGRYRILRVFVSRAKARKIFDEVLLHHRIPDFVEWQDVTETVLKHV